MARESDVERGFDENGRPLDLRKSLLILVSRAECVRYHLFNLVLLYRCHKFVATKLGPASTLVSFAK